jgi:acyl-CoA synthetase (AMP-forming)/AMP-acid ligase II
LVAVTLFSLLDQTARNFPQRGAVFVGTAQSWTYAELRDNALRIAGGLARSHAVGDRIAILSENRPEYIELLFGIWAAGMVAVPINAKLHAREITQILEDADASLIFVSPGLTDAVNDGLRMTIASAAYDALKSRDAGSAVKVTSDTLAWLFYTSGTTGRSKGAMLSHRNLLAMTTAHLADVDAASELCSLIHAAPMSHGSGLYISPYLARGARHVIPTSSGFDPAEFLDLCDQHPACRAFLAPTMVQRLRLEAERSRRRPAHLDTIIYGGGPMYVEELRKSRALFGDVFVQIYGQGESPMTITCLNRADHAIDNDGVLGSVGRARTGLSVRVVSAEGTACATGELGEIICRGDVVMSGYWKNPAATAETLRDGWLHTGDIGSLDADGYLTLRDRSKDVVISGGANIYPREVEEVLLTHPGVLETAVIGEADPEWGESVVAFVVRADDHTVNDSDLDRHCLDRIARFKRPRRYIFVDTLPKNSYGKVLKRELRRQL